MGYGTGMKLYSSRNARTTRSSVNQQYNSFAYRKSTSTISSVSSSSLSGFGKGGERTFIIDDPGAGNQVGTIGGSATTFSASAGITAVEDLLDNRNYLSNIVEDYTPQLGGNLDVNDKIISGNQVHITSTGTNANPSAKTIIDDYVMPVQTGGNGQVLSRTISGPNEPIPLAWVDMDTGGGIDYGTFSVNANGELTVEYLGGDYANAFTINNNGEMEVTI